jgi:hypothetical protein
MEIKEIKTFKFNELNEKAKEKAIEKMWDINVDYDWWEFDGLMGLTKKEKSARKIKECPDDIINWKNLYFDLDRGSYIQFIDITVPNEDVFRKFLRINKRLWGKVYYSFLNSNREINTAIEIEENEYDLYFTKKEQEIIDRAISIFNDKVKDALIDLKKQYEYLTSKEAIIETIEINEYDFREDGKLFF